MQRLVSIAVLLAAAGASACSTYPCPEDLQSSSLSAGGVFDGGETDLPDASSPDALSGDLDVLGAYTLFFVVETPVGQINAEFSLPHEAGAYSFQALVSSQWLCPARTTVLEWTPQPQCGNEGPGASAYSYVDASATLATALSLTGTVDVTASSNGACDSAVGCQYDYEARLALGDAAHGVMALDVTLSASNAERDLSCASNPIIPPTQ